MEEECEKVEADNKARLAILSKMVSDHIALEKKQGEEN